MGFCSGGRQSVLVGCRVDVDAVVDCYGAYVTGTPGPDFPLKVSGLESQLPDLRAPLLGLFGNDDAFPSPEDVDQLEA
ncbi:MAG: dienelactone hydrolase family protein, partial [Actinomycetes bacterium]